ncbi:hypothetical protein BC939DRAFT_102756 [Gamsiella multidivaricata]|uniref:uncharacterized protein n=1 Tax=Gamsiella multidivaricata TaxID=101098 RepID=UPI002220BCE8|nr:uncharacterized protein BC939DRAFT_102756 [Gamsiella multidivaricata]KAI7832392.1 hypothetical protein BC939DRAFT_102756 [Gamsiella multidivaricata]
MNLTPMFELATRVANDEKQRLDLFGDTLKQIKEQIHLKMKPLAPIANKELAREQQEAREKDIAALYKNQLDGDQGEHNHAPWLPLEDPQDEGEKDGTDVAQKDVVQKDINQKEVGQKDVNHKNVAQKDIAQEASEQDTANSGKASGRKMDKAQAHTPSSRTPLSRAAKDSRKETTTSSKPSSDRTTRTADKEVVTTRSNSSPSNMTKETIRNATTTPSKASSNDTTKDADKETPVTLTRKRPSLDRAAKDNVKRARSGEAASDSDFDLGDDLPAPVSENIEHDLIDDSIEPSEVSDSVNKQRITDEASTGTDAAAAPTATPTGSTDIHVRKKTRHWSHAEEERLQELVPQFLYKEGEAKNKKRTIKWAKLKAHDQAYGDILKHRTQIMLKDKYRDLTDGGQHRKFVSELYRKQRDVSKTQETE